MSFDEYKTKQKISMSERVGKKLKFLAKTACVHLNERELIAYAEAYMIVNPEDKEFIKFLRKVAIPALTKIGRGRWYRDQVTDLGLGLSGMTDKTKTESAKDALTS